MCERGLVTYNHMCVSGFMLLKVARFHNDALSELVQRDAAVGCIVCVRLSGCVWLCDAFCGSICAGINPVGRFNFG
jgi:hypothetical protein